MRYTIEKISADLAEQLCRQILVVCGVHDEPKRGFLTNMGLAVASEWYVGTIV
jgi:hypothetical protein